MPAEKSVAATKRSIAQYLGMPTRQDSLMGIRKQRSWAHKNSPLLVRMIENSYFECIVGFLIAFNCITIAVEVQYCPVVNSLRWMPPENSPMTVASLSDRLTKVKSGEWDKFEPSRDCPADFLQISEYALTGLFVVEFFLRVLVYGKYYYCSIPKLLDAFLVWVTGVLVVCVLEPLNASPGNVRMFTALRAFRVMRVARLVQGNPMLKQAWVLIKGLSESLKTLFWTIVVIFFVNFAFAIVATLFIGDSSVFTCAKASEEPNGQYEECAHLTDDVAVHGFFNGLGNTMFTLLQIMTGDSWASGIARPAMKFQPAVWLFFIIYVAIAMLVLLNLVTAVIVDNALTISKADEKQKLIDLHATKKAQIASLKRIFAALDVDGSGAIDETEFTQACTNRVEIMNKFRLLDFDEREMMNLFKDLEVSSDGLLTLEEFESGLNSMQGEAKNKDLVRIQKAIERLNCHVEMLSNRLPLQEGDCNDADNAMPTAFGKRRSRSLSPHKSTPKAIQSPTTAKSQSNCSTAHHGGASMSIVYKSLPGLPVVAPAIRVAGQDLDFQRLDPSVRDLADVMVNHLTGLEQRMEQKFAKLEQRQSNALEAIAAHLNMNSGNNPAGIKAAQAFDATSAV